MRSSISRLIKYLTAASKPAFWPAISKGVMPAVEHIDVIARLEPKTLIDIGANKGQFSLVARYVFPDLQIHAFEPLASEAAIFQTVVTDPVVLHETALGAAPSQATFYVTSRADSSSLLKPSSGQHAAYGVTLAFSTTVPVARLIDVLDFAGLPRPILMKVDVQGGELDVLKGSDDALRFVDAIYCEASFAPLYEGQPLANEIIAHLGERGFALRGIFNQSETRTFGPTQADFLFEALRA